MHLVYVTMPNFEQAKFMANSLIKERLAACVNIIKDVYSIYIWQENIEENDEVMLVIKSHSSLIPSLFKAIKDQHPYDCPAIEAIKIDIADKDFIKWLETSLKLA